MQHAQADATLASKNATYTEYWASGLSVLPINEAGFPSFKWGKISEGWKPDADELFSWDLATDTGFAIVCGKVSDVIAIDIDDATPEQIAKLKKLLGETPCAKIGSKGITLFYKYNGERTQSWKKDGINKVELLSDKHLTTLPPSKHRSKPINYKWEGRPLIDSILDLPLLNADYDKIIISVFSIPAKIAEPVYKRDSYDIPPTYDEACRALFKCNPDCSNDEWVQIGMAFKSEVGDAGYSDFDKWSQGGKTYDKASIRSRWKSFTSRSITYGTLIHYAKQYGYQPPRSNAIPVATIDPKEYTRIKLAHQAEKLEESEEIPEIVTNAPRLIRLLAEWMYKSAPHPQPMLSLGAAITTIGFLMGKDFKCAGSGIKANLYSICIAGSQEGKQEIVSRCRTVMKEFNMMKNYQTAWTSGAAIEAMMEETEGQVFYITDEMGILMSQLVGKHTSANQQEAVSILLRLYTENYYKGKGYAKSAEQKTVEIPDPFVSICGFTQREPFFEAMTSMQAHTGVLNRMCLFKAPDIRPKYNTQNTYEDRYNIPKDLKLELEFLMEKLPQIKVGREYVSVQKEIPFTDEAKAELNRIIIKTDERFRKSQAEGDNIHLFIGRSPEVIQKVALIGSCGGIITLEVLLWAKAVVDYTIGIMIKYSADIVDNEFDRKKNKVIEFVRKRGGSVSKTDLANNCRVFSNRREREDIVADLLDAGRLEIMEDRAQGRSKIIYTIATPPALD